MRIRSAARRRHGHYDDAQDQVRRRRHRVDGARGRARPREARRHQRRRRDGGHGPGRHQRRRLQGLVVGRHLREPRGRRREPRRARRRRHHIQQRRRVQRRRARQGRVRPGRDLLRGLRGPLLARHRLRRVGGDGQDAAPGDRVRRRGQRRQGGAGQLHQVHGHLHEAARQPARDAGLAVRLRGADGDDDGRRPDAPGRHLRPDVLQRDDGADPLRRAGLGRQGGPRGAADARPRRRRQGRAELRPGGLDGHVPLGARRPRAPGLRRDAAHGQRRGVRVQRDRGRRRGVAHGQHAARARRGEGRRPAVLHGQLHAGGDGRRRRRRAPARAGRPRGRVLRQRLAAGRPDGRARGPQDRLRLGPRRRDALRPRLRVGALERQGRAALHGRVHALRLLRRRRARLRGPRARHGRLGERDLRVGRPARRGAADGRRLPRPRRGVARAHGRGARAPRLVQLLRRLRDGPLHGALPRVPHRRLAVRDDDRAGPRGLPLHDGDGGRPDGGRERREADLPRDDQGRHRQQVDKTARRGRLGGPDRRRHPGAHDALGPRRVRRRRRVRRHVHGPQVGHLRAQRQDGRHGHLLRPGRRGPVLALHADGRAGRGHGVHVRGRVRAGAGHGLPRRGGGRRHGRLRDPGQGRLLEQPVGGRRRLLRPADAQDRRRRAVPGLRHGPRQRHVHGDVHGAHRRPVRRRDHAPRRAAAGLPGALGALLVAARLRRRGRLPAAVALQARGARADGRARAAPRPDVDGRRPGLHDAARGGRPLDADHRGARRVRQPAQGRRHAALRPRVLRRRAAAQGRLGLLPRRLRPPGHGLHLHDVDRDPDDHDQRRVDPGRPGVRRRPPVLPPALRGPDDDGHPRQRHGRRRRGGPRDGARRRLRRVRLARRAGRRRERGPRRQPPRVGRVVAAARVPRDLPGAPRRVGRRLARRAAGRAGPPPGRGRLGPDVGVGELARGGREHLAPGQGRPLPRGLCPRLLGALRALDHDVGPPRRRLALRARRGPRRRDVGRDDRRDDGRRAGHQLRRRRRPGRARRARPGPSAARGADRRRERGGSAHGAGDPTPPAGRCC